jgi:hypothetical protein
MRIVFRVALAAVFVLSTVAITGCDNGGKAQIPTTTLEVPKNGPVPAGVPGGADKDKAKGASSAQ